MLLSNYTKICEKITNFLNDHPKDFDACLQVLRSLRQSTFTALLPESNPILASMQEWTAEQLAFVIVEYSGFSNEAIHMLLDALIRNHDWKDLQQEILHNISEERGLKTRNVPHLEMMRQGYRVDLGVETDYVNYSTVTQDFIGQMRGIFKHDDNSFSAGALLAFEGVATDEFKILDAFVRQYQAMKGMGLITGSLTNLYIDGHKDFEVDHENDLEQSIRPYISPANIHRFVRGYLTVCLTMNTWWEKLAIEAYWRMLSRQLSVNDAEVFDVSQIFISAHSETE